MLATLVVVKCAWCTPPQDGDTDATHGICEYHSAKMHIESARRQTSKVPSYMGEREKFEAYRDRRRK